MSAKFLSKEDTKELVRKLQVLNKTDKNKLGKLRIEGRIKSANKSIKTNIKLINVGIKKNKKILFDYLKYDNNGIYRVIRKRCVVSPYTLAWYEDFIYMLGNYIDDKISYYRVDRMENITITSEKITPIYRMQGHPCEINFSEISGKITGMASGIEIIASINFKEEQIGKAKDKFGERIKVTAAENGWVATIIHVIYNKELVSWILRFGDGAEVIGPMELKNQIMIEIDKMKKLYCTTEESKAVFSRTPHNKAYSNFEILRERLIRLTYLLDVSEYEKNDLIKHIESVSKSLDGNSNKENCHDLNYFIECHCRMYSVKDINLMVLTRQKAL